MRQRIARRRAARFRQYSLRTLLAALTAAGVCFGALAHRAEKQRRAVAAVLAAGGEVTYDFEYGVPKDEAQPPGPAWLRELLGRDWFDTVVCVTFREAEAGDIARLPELPELREVAFRMPPPTDLTPLTKLRQLETLTMASFHPRSASPVRLAPIARIEKLKQLHLIGFDVVDLLPLNASPHLQSISVCHFEHVRLDGFTGPDTLTKLEIRDSQIRDFSGLAGLKNLTELSLQNTLVEDLSPLAGMTNLRRLDLMSTEVKDLSPLKGLKRLEVLIVEGTGVTLADMQEFERQLPGCDAVGWTPYVQARLAEQREGAP